MLDDLFGRRELRERIETLVQTRDRLEAQLEAESDRRRTAVRDRQRAEERVNRLEDQIASLEGRLDHATTESNTPTFDRVESLSRHRTDAVLARLESLRTEPEAALSAVVHDSVPEDVRSVLGERWVAIQDHLPCVVFGDADGITRAVLEPPIIGDVQLVWDDHFHVEREWFLPTGSYTFILIRSDVFALGQYEDDEQIEADGFSSEVMGRHSKGGFSQARFERRREEQIDAHLDRCRKLITEHELIRPIVVGDRRMISRLSVDAIATHPADASGSPTEALDAAFHDFWQTRLYRL